MPLFLQLFHFYWIRISWQLIDGSYGDVNETEAILTQNNDVELAACTILIENHHEHDIYTQLLIWY